MVSIEWRRELPDSENPFDGAYSEDIPYGLRISDDGLRLEVHPRENHAMMLMMELLGQDFSYSSIVSDLNEKGFCTRSGKPWDRVAVFNLMPRLIEVGPRMFASEEWKGQHKSGRDSTAPGSSSNLARLRYESVSHKKSGLRSNLRKPDAGFGLSGGHAGLRGREHRALPVRGTERVRGAAVHPSLASVHDSRACSRSGGRRVRRNDPVRGTKAQRR